MIRILVLIALALICTCTAISQTRLIPGAAAPIFSSISLDGTIYDLNALRGSVVVLTFWSTRCEICRVEFPKINQLADRYSAKSVVFLSPTMENEAKVQAYLKNNRVSSQILPNSFGLVLQYADRTKDGSLDMGFPSIYVIDQSGRIQFRASGYDKTVSLSAAVDRLLSK